MQQLPGATPAQRPTGDLSATVGAAQAGDLDAFAALVRRFQDMAYGIAYAYLGHRERAQDAAQEALVQAWEGLAALREPAAFPAWLRQIVVRRCARQLPPPGGATLPLDLAARLPDSAAGPDQAAEARELEAAVRAAIAQLPEHERLATTLYYVADYSQAEIAAVLGVPVTTVKKRLFAARRRLKERMLHMVGDALHQSRPSRQERFALGVQALAAVKKGDADSLAALLARDPTLVDVREDNQPLLFVAAMYGYGGRTKRHAPLVDLLKRHGAGQDIFAAAYLDEPDRAATLLAANPSLARAVDAAGLTALHHAAERGALQVARLLIDAGADVNARDSRGEAPIDRAGHAGPWKERPATDIVRLLLDHGAEVDVFQAAALGDVDRLRRLLDADPHLATARDEKGRSPLYEAAHNLHLDAVNLLLERGAALEAQTEWGETPLSTAVAHSWDVGGPQVVARLLAAGATPSLRDALCLGDLPRVRAFLTAHPERLAERWWDETPLHVAARWGHPDLCAYLLDLGHDPNPLDGQGNTPARLDALWRRADTVTFLESHGAHR